MTRLALVLCSALLLAASACDSPTSVDQGELRGTLQPGCSRTPLACYPNCEQFDAALADVRARCTPPPIGVASRTTIVAGTCSSYWYILKEFHDVPIQELWATRGTMAFYEASGGMTASATITDIVQQGCQYIGSWNGVVPTCELRPILVLSCR